MKLLTIAIPTYNRPEQLARLCDLLVSEIDRFNLSDKVSILICDNSCIEVAKQNKKNYSDIICYKKNNENIGYDGNILALYSEMNTKYVWYFGDDDLVVPGALNHIIEILVESTSDVLLVPFKQPPNNLKLPYQCKKEVKIYFNQSEIVDLILKTGKLTSYIIRQEKSIRSDLSCVTKYIDTGWMHQILAFECLERSNKASCSTLDFFGGAAVSEEVKQLEWTPSAFAQAPKVLSHPYVKKCINFPVISRQYRARLKIAEIFLLFLGVSGAWQVKDRRAYINYARQELKFEIFLIGKPAWFLLYLLLRMRLARHLKFIGTALNSRFFE